MAILVRQWQFIEGYSIVLVFNHFVRVGNILKGSLDSIPSPSVKNQIMGGKVCLRCKGKTFLDIVFVFKSLLTSPSNVLPYYLK